MADARSSSAAGTSPAQRPGPADGLIIRTALLGRGSRAVNVAGRQLTRASLPLERFAGDWFRLVVTDAAGRSAWSNPVWLD